MVLINCKECGDSVSKHAAACPHCGAPGQHKTSQFAWFVTILLIFGFAGYLASPSDRYASRAQTAASSDQTGRAKLTPKAVRQKQIEKQFSAQNGVHLGLEKAIKDNMNDPDSYEHIHTAYFDEGNYLAVFTHFLGRNGNNGVVNNEVIAKVDLQGTVLEIIKIK